MLRNIQVLRCIAALAVVWHHLQQRLTADLGTPVLGFGGRAGVDIFFVISGFIMFHTTARGDRTVTQFWTDRVIRIAPMYWLALLLVAVLFILGLQPIDVKAMSLKDLAEDLAFVPHHRIDGDPYPVLDVGWTLIYEMYFYFLFGLTFLLKSQTKSLALLSVIFILAALARSFGHLPYALDYLANPITLEFAAGGALALLFRRNLRLSHAAMKYGGWALLIGGAAALVVTGVIWGAYVVDVATIRVTAFGIPSVVIVAGALMLEKAGVSANSRFALLLGAASYAIYLIHQLALQLVIEPFARAFPEPGVAAIAALGLAAFAAACAAGVAIHLWIEKPVTATLQSIVRNRRRRAPVGATAD